jgi:hypothetical protein
VTTPLSTSADAAVELFSGLATGTARKAHADSLRRAIERARKATCEVRPQEFDARTYIVTTPEGHAYKVWFKLDESGLRQGYCNCQTDHSKYACYVMVWASIADSYDTAYPPCDSLLFAEYVLRVKGERMFSDEEWTRVRTMVLAPSMGLRAVRRDPLHAMRGTSLPCSQVRGSLGRRRRQEGGVMATTLLALQLADPLAWCRYDAACSRERLMPHPITTAEYAQVSQATVRPERINYRLYARVLEVRAERLKGI